MTVTKTEERHLYAINTNIEFECPSLLDMYSLYFSQRSLGFHDKQVVNIIGFL